VSLADNLRGLTVPAEWRARQVILGEEAEITTGPIAEVENHRQLLEQFGYNPDDYEITGTVNQWRKQQADGEWLTSYFFKVAPSEATLDLPALYAISNRKPRTPVKVTANSRVTVVALSDVQAGKTGSRGGTPELLDRLANKRAALEAHLRKTKPQATVLAECGDLFEGFESGGNPAFTNDLSLAQQMDLAGTEVYRFVELMQRHGHVDVVAVTSNHTAWRRGKVNLGRPSDDLGLFVHKQVKKVADAAGIDVTWTIPAEYDESTVIDVIGTRLGLVHGNQYGPGKAVEWWARQQHGGQPVAAADILLGGHYHCLHVQPTGRNPYTGRSKWFIQAPTTDNGSDWFRNIRGEDSDPGLLVFDITENGFDLQSLTVL
jgi:hypothetical protein